MACGTKCLVPSTSYQVLGTKDLVPSTWYQVPGTKYLVPSTLEPSTWYYQVPGTKNLVPSTWYQVLGTKEISLVSACAQFGIGLGSVWGRFEDGLGSVWGRFGIDLKSIWGRCGIGLGTFLNNFRGTIQIIVSTRADLFNRFQAWILLGEVYSRLDITSMCVCIRPVSQGPACAGMHIW